MEGPGVAQRQSTGGEVSVTSRPENLQPLGTQQAGKVSPGGQIWGKKGGQCTPFPPTLLSGNASAAEISTAGRRAYLLVRESAHL